MNASVDTSISPAQAEVNTLVANGLTALDDFLKLNQEQIDCSKTVVTFSLTTTKTGF